MIHSRKLTRFMWIAAITLIALGAILAAVVAFGVAPPPLASLTQAFAHMDTTGLPAISRYRAQDGAMLAYRVYPGEGQQVAALIHGSSGQGSSMNALARTLNGTGATVYTLDVRGHGSSGRRGDIDYIGQLDDGLHIHRVFRWRGFHAADCWRQVR
jgi:non-heme chloroperoxidase